MKSIRILSVALSLATASLLTQACSSDKTQEDHAAQVQQVEDLYNIVKTVELDLSQGFLLRNASDRERTGFKDVLYQIKVATMRLRDEPMSGEALSQLYIASQELDKLNVLNHDITQLEALNQKLRETLDVLAKAQGRTLENIDRVLFDKDFNFELAPFTQLTSNNSKLGWTKGNHEEIHYAKVGGKGIVSWLFSPVLDLSQVKNPSFSVSQALNSFGSDPSINTKVVISENYTGGNPSDSTWQILNIRQSPDGSGFAIIDSEKVSLQAFAGKKIVIGFVYDTLTTASYPTWQLNRFRIYGTGEVGLTQPLSLTGTVTSGISGGNASQIAALCTNDSQKTAFTFNFGNQVLDGNFTTVNPNKTFYTAGTKYPGVVNFSGFNASGNKVGTAWLVSKPIDLSGSNDACLSVADEAYFASAGIDANLVQILVSTNYTGDVEKATWKTVNFQGRRLQDGLVAASKMAPKANGIKLAALVGQAAGPVTIAFKATTTESNAPWWGIANLTITAKGDVKETPVVGGTVAPTNNTSSGSGTTSNAPAALGPAIAAACTANGLSPLFSFDFAAKNLTDHFVTVDTLKNFFNVGTKYPSVVNFTGYNKEGNRAGVSWLISKPINLSGATDGCLSISDDVFFPDGVELGQAKIVIATNYTGDPQTTDWKEVNLANRKTQQSVVAASKLSPVANSVKLSDLVDASATQVVIGFRYEATAGNAPWWGIRNLTITAKGSFTPSTSVTNPAPVTTPRAPSSTGSTNTPAPLPVMGPAVAELCTQNAASTELFAHKFSNAELEPSFTAVDDLKNFYKVGTKYPEIANFSGYNKTANRAGTSWLVSQAIDVAGVSELCLSVSDKAYFPTPSVVDMSLVQVLVSTDYAGDVNTANWTEVVLEGRATEQALVNPNNLLPVANAKLLAELVGADAKTLTVAFKYTAKADNAPWWGLRNLTVTGVKAAAE